MPRIMTPSFVAEFPLDTTPAEEHTMSVRFDAAGCLSNACLGETLKRFALMRKSLKWKTICEARKCKERTAAFKAIREEYGCTSASVQQFAEKCRDSCWIGNHLHSHDTQTISLRAFRAVERYVFGVKNKGGKFVKCGKPRFKRRGSLNSIEGKMDAVIRFHLEPIPIVLWSGLTIPLILDAKDKKGWQAEVLSCRTKYVRIVRRELKGRTRWYVQLIQEGIAPQLCKFQEGVVGLDVGPSTIAAVSANDAILEKFCPTVEQPWKQLRVIERAMDRSRRATNPDNFDRKGKIKKGKKKWIRSNRYRKLATKRRERERRLAAERKRSHGEMGNRILGQGTTIKTERVSYKSFQKNFGRSVKVRAPGMCLAGIQRKAESAGGGFIEINTRTTKLSQYDHTTGDYVKKPLSQRTHFFGDGKTEPVQRDLYSAFLASCCDGETLNITQVSSDWAAAEPLLRRAMLRNCQPASGKGFSLTHVNIMGTSEQVASRMRAGTRTTSETWLVEEEFETCSPNPGA